MAEARDLVAELIAIPSPSGGEGRIVDWLERHVAELGLRSRRVPAEVGRDNLVVGAARPLLTIVAHVDTITPTWPRATEPRIEGDVVRGLGAVDDKGSVAACLLTLRRLLAAGVDVESLPVAFAFSVDEETGGSGSRALALDLMPRYAIAMEGTRLCPGTAESSDFEAIVTVDGVSAHGSLSELGDNAVHRAARLVTELPQLGLEATTHPLLGPSQASVIAIASGAGMNVVPATCDLRLRVRIVPGQDLAETTARIERFCEARNATLTMVEATEPFELAADSPLRTAVDDAVAAVRGAVPEPTAVPAWTDAHNFVDYAGSEALVFGPGSVDSAHTPDEWIDATEIEQCARVFEQLLAPERLAVMEAVRR